MHIIRLPGTVSRPAETMLRPMDITSAMKICQLYPGRRIDTS
jgi:hypothetical protein